MNLEELNKITFHGEKTSAVAVIEDALESERDRNERYTDDYQIFDKALDFFQTLLKEYEELKELSSQLH